MNILGGGTSSDRKLTSHFEYSYLITPGNFLNLSEENKQKKLGQFFDILRTIEKPIRITMSTKIMLGLNEQAADAAQEILKLSESERDYLTKFSAGQALFLADDYKVVTKFEPTEEEREMFDTTPTNE